VAASRMAGGDAVPILGQNDRPRGHHSAASIPFTHPKPLPPLDCTPSFLNYVQGIRRVEVVGQLSVAQRLNQTAALVSPGTVGPTRVGYDWGSLVWDTVPDGVTPVPHRRSSRLCVTNFSAGNHTEALIITVRLRYG
jgi:hypothetical protein